MLYHSSEAEYIPLDISLISPRALLFDSSKNKQKPKKTISKIDYSVFGSDGFPPLTGPPPAGGEEDGVPAG
jgi:hypothetical protein